MKIKSSGYMMVNGALAVFAGVLGSLLTLLVTSNLQVPVVIEDFAKPVEVPDDDQIALAQRQVLFDEKQTDTHSADDEFIHEELKAATEERSQLAQALAQLTAQIESLESDFINSRAMEALEDTESEQSQESDLSEIEDNDNFGPSQSGQDRIDTLVAAGIAVESAQALQAQQDQFQLARLELFDQAEREGWIDSEQFSDRLDQLNEQRPDLRNELGDEAYDRYLFEAGRSNRVVVGSIIPGSAAELAGLEPGDMVISYADQRVFSTGDLQSATREGVRGESVPMNLERQGQPLFVEIPRGPMGVTLVQEQQNPS